MIDRWDKSTIFTNFQNAIDYFKNVLLEFGVNLNTINDFDDLVDCLNSLENDKRYELVNCEV